MSSRTRKLRGKGRVTVTDVVRTFNVGDKIIISPKAQRAGMPHLRYSNKHGTIVEKRGRSYVVEIADYKKKKQVIVGPVHIKLA